MFATRRGAPQIMSVEDSSDNSAATAILRKGPENQ